MNDHVQIGEAVAVEVVGGKLPHLKPQRSAERLPGQDTGIVEVHTGFQAARHQHIPPAVVVDIGRVDGQDRHVLIQLGLDVIAVGLAVVAEQARPLVAHHDVVVPVAIEVVDHGTAAHVGDLEVRIRLAPQSASHTDLCVGHGAGRIVAVLGRGCDKGV